MDPVSFAVGIIGLAGLFSTCLDAVERFDAWKDFGTDYRSVAAQFKAQKLRLEKWGQAVGLQEDTLLEKHNKFLDDPQTKSIVGELLSAIKAICSYQDEAFPAPSSATEPKSFKDQLWPRHGHSGAPHESKRQKLSWALRDKARRMAQIGQFSTLVDNLYSLVPTTGMTGEQSSRFTESARLDDFAKTSGRYFMIISSEQRLNHHFQVALWIEEAGFPNLDRS